MFLFFLCSHNCPKQARTSFPFYKSFYSIVSAKVSVSNAVQKLQLNDLLIFPRIYEPLKRWAPNALETLHKKKHSSLFWPKWLLGRKQFLVPVFVYVSKSDWMLNQLTSKSVPHNDNSLKRYLISNLFFFFTNFMYLTFVFLVLFLYHLCITVRLFNFLKAKSDLWILFCSYQSWFVKSKNVIYTFWYSLSSTSSILE